MSKFIIAVCCTIAAVSSAAADDGRREADAHARHAIALYTLNRYAEAIAEFEEAYLLYPSTTLLYNLGQAHRQLDHSCDALSYYHRFLAAQPTSPLAPRVAELLPSLQEACDVKTRKPEGVAPSTTATPPAPPPPPATPAVAPEPTHVETHAPAAAPDYEVRASFEAMLMLAGSAHVAPTGVSVSATRWCFERRVQLGGVLGGAWFDNGSGHVGSLARLQVVAAREVPMQTVTVRLAAAAGVQMLDAPPRALVAENHPMPSAVWLPALTAGAAVDYPVSGAWLLSAGATVGAAPTPDLSSGVLLSLGLSLSVGGRW